MTEAAASSPSGGRVGGVRPQVPSRLLSDERLARRAAAGDQPSFEEIFRRYHQASSQPEGVPKGKRP